MKNKSLCVGLVLVFLLLGGCNTQLLNGLNGMAIENVEPRDYVGFSDQPPPIDRGLPMLPETIVVTYPQLPKRALTVLLNGHSVGQYFHMGRESAYGLVSDLKAFVQDGENLLQVEPWRLGPSVKFYADTQGPQIVVQNVCIEEDLLCPVTGKDVQVRLSVSDGSPVDQVRFENHLAEKVNNDGVYQSIASVSNDNIYDIVATDINGYESHSRYLKNGASVSHLFKMRLNLRILDKARPLMNEGSTNMSKTRAQLIAGGMTDRWIDAGNVVAAVLWVKINELHLGTVNVTGIEKTGDDDFPLQFNVTLSPSASRENGLVFHGQTAGSVLFKYGFGARPDQPTDAGAAMTGPNSLTIKAKYVHMKMRVKLAVKKGRLTFEVDNNSELELNGTSGGAVATLAGFFHGPMFRAVMNNTIENSIQNTMPGINLRNAFTNETGQQFDLALGAETIHFDNNAEDFVVSFNGKMDVVKRNANVRRTLGAFYNNKAMPRLMNVANGDDELAVTVNSNIINQAFYALYSVGMTHLSLMLSEGKIHFGPNAIDDSQGLEGDKRIELVPSTPGMIQFSTRPGESNAVTIRYNSAEMIISTKRGGKWEPDFIVNTDLSAGLNMQYSNNALQVAIDGSPTLKINKIVNNTALPLSKAIIDPLLDVAVNMMMPILAKAVVNVSSMQGSQQSEDGMQFIKDLLTADTGKSVIDILIPQPKPNILKLVPTGFDAKGGHFRFAFGIR